MKVCDSGTYSLINDAGEQVAYQGDYVPSFFPGEHYGDYLIFEIAAGRITNWKQPSAQKVESYFWKQD